MGNPSPEGILHLLKIARQLDARAVIATLDAKFLRRRVAVRDTLAVQADYVCDRVGRLQYIAHQARAKPRSFLCTTDAPVPTM